jgi:CheY-like chemotaxis protein
LNTELLVQLLEDEYELVTAEDGLEAVKKAQQTHPDLIVMDMSLPLLDGYEAAQRIKADNELTNIPIIGLSAHAMQGDQEKAIAAGCDAYLTKPLKEALLFELLDNFLQ